MVRSLYMLSTEQGTEMLDDVELCEFFNLFFDQGAANHFYVRRLTEEDGD